MNHLRFEWRFLEMWVHFFRNLCGGRADKESMTALGYHMMCRLRDNRVIASSRERRLAVSRIILERSRPFRLLVFRLADSHFHFEVSEPYAVAMELARRIEIAIQRKLGLEVGFSRSYPQEIRNQAHLFNTFDYILRQRENHGLPWDARAEASNLPDLLGLRLLVATPPRSCKSSCRG